MVEVYETLPIVPLRDVVVFPHMMMPFVIGRPSSIRALEHALGKDKRIFLAAQHDASTDDPKAEDIFTMGCVANVVQSLKLPDSNIKVLVEGVDRARVIEWKEDKGFYRVVVKVLQRQKDAAGDVEQTMSRVVTLFEQYVKLSNNLHYDAMIAAVRVDDPGKLADTISAIASSESSVKRSFTFSYSKSFWYCRVMALRGWVRIWTSAGRSSSWSAPITGKRPTNSGMRPNLMRSWGSACSSIVPTS